MGGLRPAAKKLNLPIGKVRSVVDGRDIKLSNAIQIADALNLEIYIGPPRNREQLGSVETARAHPKIDKELACMINWLASEWKKADARYRVYLQACFRHCFRDFSG